MQRIQEIVRRYPVSTMYVVAIWVLSLMDVPETPLSDVTLIDKWVHIAMYLGTTAVIYVEQYMRPSPFIRRGAGESKWRFWVRLVSLNRSQQGVKALLVPWVLMTLMGGLLELLQAYCTGGRRSGEWLDFVADGLGSTLALLLCLLVRQWRKG